jgi:glycosyltransferase involved in cell wall biosynthesis
LVNRSRIVLHLIHTLDPDTGGPVEGIRQFISGYQQHGWTLEVACLDDPSAAWLAHIPVKVHALGPGLGAFGFRPEAIWRLRDIIGQYRALIVDGIWDFTGPMAMLATAGSRTPYFVFTHGMLDPWFKRRYPLKHLKKWAFWPWSTYWLLRNAAGVFFTTEEERILARQSFWLYRCRELVVGYGTGAPQGDPAWQLGRFRAAFGDRLGRRNLLYLGRIHPKKGCDLLIEAFAKVMGADANWRLVVAGPDPTCWRSQLEGLARRLCVADRIVWTGPVEGDLKWGAFYAADAFVLPSHQENFGVVVAEALACSLPTLISDKVNIWREVAAAGAGLVAPDTLEGAIALLERWMATPPDAVDSMRAAARRCFDAQFEIGATSRRIIDIIEGGGPPT